MAAALAAADIGEGSKRKDDGLLKERLKLDILLVGGEVVDNWDESDRLPWAASWSWSSSDSKNESWKFSSIILALSSVKSVDAAAATG